MHEKKLTNYQDNEISLVELVNISLNRKGLLSSIVIGFSLLSLIYSLTLPNIYTSDALLAPSSQDESLSSRLGGLSSIAGFAGIDIGNETATLSAEAMERIKSFDFFAEHFLSNIKLENLMAVTRWDQETNFLIYDESIYDIVEKKWVREVSFPKKAKPSNQEAYLVYLDKIDINEDQNNNFVSISINHHSPILAKEWLGIVIHKINESMRDIEKKSAEDSINFLNQSTNFSNVQSIQFAISSLLEMQMQEYMLASVNQDYVYRIISKPLIPEEPSSPNRLLICILGFLFGVIVSGAIVITIYIKKYI